MTVTRDDVAREAGVSPAVVSYVVNDGPRPVAAKTRARVEEAIGRLGYQPDMIAGALRGGCTRTIGMLAPQLTNPYFAELAVSIENELFDRDHALAIGVVNDDPRRTALQLQSLRSRRVDGLVLLDAQAAASVAAAGWHDRVVVVDQIDTGRAFSSVHVDNSQAAASAVRYLQQLGHRVIGCVAGPRSNAASASRIEGWREQLERGGVVPGEDLIARVDWSETGGASAVPTLIGPDSRPVARRRTTPTALLVNSDIQALGVLAACHRLGIRVPDDVSLISIDGTQIASYVTPRLTTIRHPYPAIAGAAVQVLLEELISHSGAPREQVLRGNLLIGETTAVLTSVTPSA